MTRRARVRPPRAALHRRGARGRRTAATACVAVVLAIAAPASAAWAQVTPDSLPPPPPETGGWGGYAVASHPWSTVVAVTVALPVGSASDPEGLEGTAWLLGESILADLRERWRDHALHADVSVERSRTVFRVLTTPERWPEALAGLDDALFGLAFDAPGFTEARADLEASLTFESGSPAEEFEREFFRLLAGPGDPWGRNPRGTLDSVVRAEPAELILFRVGHYRRGEATLSVTGAVEPARVTLAVTGVSVQDTVPASRSGPVVAAVAPDPPTGLAWQEGERVRVMPEVTSSWIGVAYPVAPATDPTALELLVYRLREELVTDPPPPGLFSAEIGLEYMGRRPVLVVRTAVVPEATDEWEGRILDTVRSLSGEVLEEEFFGWHRRRFRAARLLQEMTPEEEGRRMALDLLRDGAVRNLRAAIRELRPDVMALAGTALGAPRIFIFGPDLGAPQDRRPLQ